MCFNCASFCCLIHICQQRQEMVRIIIVFFKDKLYVSSRLFLENGFPIHISDFFFHTSSKSVSYIALERYGATKDPFCLVISLSKEWILFCLNLTPQMLCFNRLSLLQLSDSLGNKRRKTPSRYIYITGGKIKCRIEILWFCFFLREIWKGEIYKNFFLFWKIHRHITLVIIVIFGKICSDLY